MSHLIAMRNARTAWQQMCSLQLIITVRLALCVFTTVALVSLILVTSASAQTATSGDTSSSKPATEVELTDEEMERVEAAVDRAVAYLLTQQQGTGAIHDRRHETTMTSLSLMAMAAVGHQPGDRTPEGDAMYRGLEFVLGDDRRDNRGYFGRADQSRMYGHGITTLMLTELLGMGRDETQDQRMHDALDQAIGLTLAAQRVSKPKQFQGGWRYEPDARDADLSVSVWQLMALRSAKNDGLDVPSEAIDAAVEYLRNSYTERNRENVAGGFAYMPRQTGATFTMSAAGLLAMQVCGRYEATEVEGSTRWLLEHPPRWEDRFFFYGCYYYAQGMHQRGGDTAITSGQRVREMLLARQQNDGSWDSSDGQERDAGRVYSTSLAILSLSVPYHYLPIYQR